MTPGPGIARTSLPRAFFSSGINSGVRRYRPDIGLIVSDVPAKTVAVYTQNSAQAAPIRYCKKVLPAENLRAIFTNSGQANAATGSDGDRKNLAMVEEVASQLKISPDQVAIASTGVIGDSVQTDKILPAIPELVQRLTDSAEPFAISILTTDLVPKSCTVDVELSGGSVRLTGIAKGSGMIHPNMATMLGYVLTDANLDLEYAQEKLRSSVDRTFNMISVDGDTSTNDTVFMMSNGASEVSLSSDRDRELFESALEDICRELAKAIARDGEGATKLIEVNIDQAIDERVAKDAAKGLILSPLVKTAVHGEDPNWGRILASLGQNGVSEEALERMSILFQGVRVYDGVESQGPCEFDRESLAKLLKKDHVTIEVNLRGGNFSATAWGCDLSKKYIEINAEYTT